MTFETDIFSLFDKKWALLCAGTPEDHNSMTISWGALGTLWGAPCATVYVRFSRHTFGFMNDNEYFTVSFYPEKYRKALALMGSRSGRDINKDEAAGLTPEALENGVTYKEAEVTLVCRKRYAQDMDPAAVPPEVMKENYADGDLHRIYIGEVVDILRKTEK
ncbi:MAG: flavin reductase [Abditibacteriota bacterium]|nr:flavin reductase [Abditibacteriota bacterium]